MSISVARFACVGFELRENGRGDFVCVAIGTHLGGGEFPDTNRTIPLVGPRYHAHVPRNAHPCASLSPQGF